MRSFVIGFLFLCFFAPLISVFWHILVGLWGNIEGLSYFMTNSFAVKIMHSFWLSLGVAFTSCIWALLIATSFFTLKLQWHKIIYLLLLFLLFSVSPIIYLTALSQLDGFNRLPVFAQALLTLVLHLSPLVSMILIFSLSKLDFTSLQIASRMTTSWYLLGTIVLPQMVRPISVSFLIAFMLTFVHEEVPSFLGYRTYAEEFLSRIIAMDNIYEISYITLPFIVLAVVVLLLVVDVVKQQRSFIDNHYKAFQCVSLKGIGRFSIIFLALLVIGMIGLLILEINDNVFVLLKDSQQAAVNSMMLALITGIVGAIVCWSIYPLILSQHSQAVLYLFVLGMLLYWLMPSSLSGLTLVPVSLYLTQFGAVFEYVVLIFAYVIRVIPIGIAVIASINLLQKNEPFLHLNRLDGFGVFKYLTVPISWGKWLFLVAILSVFTLNELTTTILLIPPGEETMIIKMYNLMHYGDHASVAFLSLLQVSVIAALVMISGYAFKRQYDFT